MAMRFGVHVSIAGGLAEGLKRALEMGCDTAQFFLMNPRAWNAKYLTDEDVQRFLEVRYNQAKGLYPLIAHMPYLPNLAALDAEIFQKSIRSLRDNLMRCEALKIDFLVMHMGKGDPEAAQERMLERLKRVFDQKTFKTCLLLENTAGQGRDIGSQVSELSEFYAKIPKGICKGICLDTCHAFAAGYDLRKKHGVLNLIKKFDQTIGFEEVKLIHLNDSMKELGSRVDRHAKIGQGCIGEAGFKALLSTRRIKPLPCILEVPTSSPEDDIYQLKLIRELSSSRPK